ELTGAPLPEYAGRGMGFPTIVRLVEFNGEATTARVRVPGPVASAYRTNLMGETIETLSVSPADAPVLASAPDTWSEFELTLRPHEIATVYLDLVYGRKVPRNLDEHRHIWATVHRMDTAEE